MKPIKTLKDEYINSNMLELFEQDEVIEEVESFFLTPLNQQKTGLYNWWNFKIFRVIKNAKLRQIQANFGIFSTIKIWKLNNFNLHL